MTQEDARLLIRTLIDDPNGARWSDPALDILVNQVQDELFSEILRSVPYYTSSLETVTTLTSPGYINAAIGGDLTNRFYRIQKITRDGHEYSPVKQKSVVIEDAEADVYEHRTYTTFGKQVWLFKLETTPEVEIRYSYLPATWSSLDDEDSVVWPEGHDGAFIYTVAGRCVGKGVAEDPTNFAQIGDRLKYAMISSIERLHPGPLTVYFSSDPIEFGSTE